MAAHVGQSLGNLFKSCIDADHGAVHIRAVLKFQLDNAVILIADRVDIFHMRNRAERLLEGDDDIGLDLFGRCAGIGGDHHEIGHVHLRQQIHRHFQHGNGTDNEDRNNGNKDGKGLLDTELGHTQHFLQACAFFIIPKILHAPKR